MTNNNRDTIYRVNEHSSVSEKTLNSALTDYVYAGKKEWSWFIKLLVLSLGACFTVAGILFFFAYNWTELHKFAKLGLIQGLLICAISITLIPSFSKTIKSIVLAAASMLVGVLFAVFGQIYQTGANAYDFFLGWSIFIFLWVLISNFPPLWLIFVVLVETTVHLYAEQVAYYWEEQTPFIILFCLNVLFLATTIYVKSRIKGIHVPIWFVNTLSILAAIYGTAGAISELFQYHHDDRVYIFVYIVLVVYGLGVYFGLRKKSIFYLVVIAFSSIIIISAIIIRAGGDFEMFFGVFIFSALSVTGVIKGLLTLQKKWSNE